MKPTPDDPRLSAWLLGELPPAEAAAIERAVAADPALRLAVKELKKVTSSLEAVLSTAPAGLRPGQREAIFRAAREADGAGKIVELPSARRGRNPWLAAWGAAAAVILAVGLAAKLAGPAAKSGKSGGEMALADEIALLPMPVPGGESGRSGAAGGGETAAAVPAEREAMLRDDPAGFLDHVSRRLAGEPPDPAKLPRVHPLPALSAAGEVRLPLVVGHASYGWVRDWVRKKGELPPKDAVRIEELVQTFPLETGTGGLRVEAAECPWNPAAKLVACTLRAPEEKALEMSWVFVPADGAVCRLLAAPGDGRSALPVRLSAGRSVTVLLEVRPAAGGNGLGCFKMRSRGGEVREVEVGPVTAPSAAMRQLGLMASFGLWLRGEGVEAMAAILEAAGEDADPGRADSRKLVREALGKAGR